MATVRLLMLFCVRHASGTDFGATQAIAGLADFIPASQFGSPLSSVISNLPQVIAAIDTARSDPDDLFVTTDTTGDFGNSFWPPGGQTQNFQAGQSATVMLDFEFAHSINFSLWDYDSSSPNDLLGSVTVFEQEAGTGEIAKLAKSDVEGSAYYVFYEVFS